ncbi:MULTISPECIES: M13 family metallopeptidase [Anaeromyxobacter]|uniref:M13 family metallopeptidase n=1 Tax=Anaeromyxobacter TaxID=161492 RepID=UPI001F5A163B|nr:MULTISPECIES: M13 family metallopeptidase [unclassified Anaeromyxobacter]
MILRTALVLSVAALAACAGKKPSASGSPPQAQTPAAGPHGVELAAMNPSVKPGDDFYEYANGGFMRTAEIPPDRASTGAFLRVFETVEARNRGIVEEAARGDAPAGTDARKIGDLYASFMDEAGLEAKGLEPLRPTLARIAALSDARALAAELGATVRADVDIFNCTNLTTSRPLGVFVEQDLDEPARNAVYLVQGGLGLPDRDYYLDASPRFAALRAQYRAHLEKTFALAGLSEPGNRAERVLAFETRLAKTHGSREEAGDVQKGNHPWTRADLEQRAPGMDWGAFLRAAALDGQQRFIAWQPTALTGLAALVKSEPLSTWKDYLTVRALDRAAPLLSRALSDEAFAFYGTALNGTPQQRARWKRGLGVVDAALGEAVGRIYVQRYFPPEAKAEIQGMVRNLREAFARRIDALDWMAPATKARAKEKLAVLEVGVGYPDRWIDYGGLEIVKGDLLGDVERAELFEYRRQLAKLGKAPDRGEWCMLPHTVNAVNLPVRNALNFPAGFMEPPFYDRGATAAVKYASIGATIGHEISHSFDDQGALFDARGKLENWWTQADLARFQAAAQKLVTQYDAYRPFPDAAVNGKLTLSENIADLAGLAAAYDAWRASLGGVATPRVGGLDGEQQFFVGYAQTWQTKAREPAVRRQLLTDGHAPGRYRSLTVRNLDPWYAAFDVEPGQALYLDRAARVQVW